jgi:glycosyltransferase involved in cell wall biosynthesis
MAIKIRCSQGPRCLHKSRRCQTQGFILIGGGSLERELSARVNAAGLADRVALLGEVSDAASYIRQFDVLALPSHYQGLPLVLLEAAASQVPVVAFDVGGVREVLDTGGADRKIYAVANASRGTWS